MNSNRRDPLTRQARFDRRNPVSIILLCTLCLWQSPATAEWHGNIRLLSDYIHRGYSKSRGNPVVQAQTGYQTLDGLFSGVQASQVRFDDQPNSDRAEFEARLYLGKYFSLTEDLRAELSASGYVFDGELFDHSADYAEVYAALHYQDWLSIRVAIAPDAYQRNANVRSYELNYRRDLLDSVQFSTGLGFSQASQLLEQDYFYWNAGISWFVTAYLSLDLRYVDVALSGYHLEPITGTHNSEFYPRPQDNNFQFTLSLGF